MFVIQIVKVKGVKVFVMGGSEEKLKKFCEFGVDIGINYKIEDFMECCKVEMDGKGL